MPPPIDSKTVERALLVLAINAGNGSAASRQLAEEGIDVDPATLRRWRRETYADQYVRIERTYTHEQEDSIAGIARDNALAAALLEAELIERTRSAMPTMSSKDAAVAARNIADVKSKNIDKLLALKGTPDAREQGGDLATMLRALVDAKLIRPAAPEAQSVVDATAIEIDPPTE